MGSPFRLAVAGCGDIATDLARVVKITPGVRITACADVNEERLQAYARRFNIPAAYRDYRELLEREKPDALFLSVPHHLHHPMVIEALKRGSHVLCEKPLAVSMDCAREMCREARLRGLKLGVNYQYRYDRNAYRLAMACRGGALGAISHGRCNLAWFRGPDYFAAGPWRGRKDQAGGGTLITQAGHWIDIILWAMGGRPVAAEGMTARRKFPGVEVEDLAMGTVEMDNGALISITSAMTAVPHQKIRIEVYGEKGTLIYTGPDDFPPSSKLKRLGVTTGSCPMPVPGLFSLQRNLVAFCRWVRDDAPYLNRAEDSLPALAAVMAIYASAGSGKKEPVDGSL